MSALPKPSDLRRSLKIDVLSPSRSNSAPVTPGGIFRNLFKTISALLKLAVVYKFGLKCFENMQAKWPKVKLEEKRSGQVCVLTGGGRGIGFEILKVLVQLDFTVILGVRNVEEVHKKVEAIRKSGISLGRVRIFYLDLKSLGSVRKFADQLLLLPEANRIDLLINNAGIFQRKFERTENNLECHFQVNYLSHFLLTNLLLPRIKLTASSTSSETCTIINVTSCFHGIGHLNLDDIIDNEKFYPHDRKWFAPYQTYADSKLYQVMHTKILQNKLTYEGWNKINIFAIHPGEIPTDIWKDLSIFNGVLHSFFKRIHRTPEAAANLTVYPAVNPNLFNDLHGKYFENGKVKVPHAQVQDNNLLEGLYKVSKQLTSKYDDTNAEALPRKVVL